MVVASIQLCALFTKQWPNPKTLVEFMTSILPYYRFVRYLCFCVQACVAFSVLYRYSLVLSAARLVNLYVLVCTSDILLIYPLGSLEQSIPSAHSLHYPFT